MFHVPSKNGWQSTVQASQSTDSAPNKIAMKNSASRLMACTSSFPSPCRYFWPCLASMIQMVPPEHVLF